MNAESETYAPWRSKLISSLPRKYPKAAKGVHQEADDGINPLQRLSDLGLIVQPALDNADRLVEPRGELGARADQDRELGGRGGQLGDFGEEDEATDAWRSSGARESVGEPEVAGSAAARTRGLTSGAEDEDVGDRH